MILRLTWLGFRVGKWLNLRQLARELELGQTKVNRSLRKLSQAKANHC